MKKQRKVKAIAPEGEFVPTEELVGVINWCLYNLYQAEVGDFAKALGITRMQLWSISTGKTPPSDKIMKKLDEIDPRFSYITGTNIVPKIAPTKAKKKKKD